MNYKKHVAIKGCVVNEHKITAQRLTAASQLRIKFTVKGMCPAASQPGKRPSSHAVCAPTSPPISSHASLDSQDLHVYLGKRNAFFSLVQRYIAKYLYNICTGL